MAIVRVVKDKDNPYLTVNKYYVYDNRLSLKATGLMTYFLSRPDDWEFYVSEIEKHFTDKEKSISNAISELVDVGYIERELKRDEKGKLSGGYDYTVYETPKELRENEVTATTEPIRQKAYSAKSLLGEKPIRRKGALLNNDLELNNNLKLNNDINNIYSQVVDYLNLKANTSFKVTSKATKTLINARIKEGYTLEEFKIVIDKKTKNWLGNEFEMYLRPSTLFSPKNFENYLNEKEKGGVSFGSSSKNNGKGEIKQSVKFEFNG